MNVVLKHNLELAHIVGDYYKNISYKTDKEYRCLYKITDNNIEVVGFIDDVSTIKCNNLNLKNVCIRESHLKGENIEVFNSFIDDSHIVCEEPTLIIKNSLIKISNLKGRFIKIEESHLERVREYKYNLELCYAEKYDIKS